MSEDTWIEETERPDITEEGWVPPEPHGYSIAAKAGPEFAAQLKLADWHLRKAAELEAVTSALVAPFDEEIKRLEAERARILAEREALVRVRQRDVEWHKAQVEWWFQDQNVRETTGKATLRLPYGAIKSRQTPGRTEVNEEEVLRLWREDPDTFSDCIREVVDKASVRKRFVLLDSGEVEDTVTGEIHPQGILAQTEPPGLTVTVELAGTPKSED